MSRLLAEELLNHENNDLQLAIQQSIQISQEESNRGRRTEYDPTTIKISIETYDKTKHINTCCPITFDDYIHNESKVAVLECLHCFQEEYIKRWIAEKPECPVCRFKLECLERQSIEEDTALFLNSIHILANMRNYNTRTTHAERENADDGDDDDDDDNTDDDDVEAETENYDLNAEYLEDFRLV